MCLQLHSSHLHLWCNPPLKWICMKEMGHLKHISCSCRGFQAGAPVWFPLRHELTNQWQPLWPVCCSCKWWLRSCMFPMLVLFYYNLVCIHFQINKLNVLHSYIKQFSCQEIHKLPSQCSYIKCESQSYNDLLFSFFSVFPTASKNLKDYDW